MTSECEADFYRFGLCRCLGTISIPLYFRRWLRILGHGRRCSWSVSIPIATPTLRTFGDEPTSILTFLCLKFPSRRMPFAFLDDLQTRFTSFSPSSTSSLSTSPPTASSYASFTPTLQDLLQTYNTSPPQDSLSTAQQNLAQVKDIMVHNVEQILSRGERIELLVDKTDTFASQATAFRRGARQVRREQFWRNQKILFLSIAVGIVSSSIPSRCDSIRSADDLFVAIRLYPNCPVLWCWSESLQSLILSSPMGHTLLA